MRSVTMVLLAAMLLVASATGVWAAEVTPEGRIFAGFSYNVSSYPDWDSRYGDNDFNAFEISRAYLGFKAKLSDSWFARVTGDVTRLKTSEAVYDDTGALVDVETTEGIYAYYLKYAYGDYVPYSAFGVRFGQVQTAFIEYFDKAFGYRYLVKSPSDQWKFDTSADLGLALHGKFPANYGSYYVIARNGEGYKHPEENKGKGIQAAVQLMPLASFEAGKGLQIVGSMMQNNESASDPDVDTTLINALIAYKYMFTDAWGLNLGGGYGLRTVADDSVQDDIQSTIAHGFAVVYLPQHFGLFARADMHDPDTNNDKTTHGYQDEETMVLGGVSFDPIKNVSLALDYRTTRYTAEVVDDNGDTVTKSADAFAGIHAQVKF
jgi:hypothetical protein